MARRYILCSDLHSNPQAKKTTGCLLNTNDKAILFRSMFQNVVTAVERGDNMITVLLLLISNLNGIIFVRDSGRYTVPPPASLFI